MHGGGGPPRFGLALVLSDRNFCMTLNIGKKENRETRVEQKVARIQDPVVDATYRDIWMATAKKNTMIYQDVFSCVPSDLIHSRAAFRRAAFRQSVSHWKEKLGHTTIDLGIAPEKLEAYQNGNPKDTDPLERLQSVRGHLVSFTLDFMCHEDLRPVFNESEFYASQVFH